MQVSLYTEVAAECINHKGEKICGDNFTVRRSDNGNRTIAILSDGLGHGVRANILSVLTSSMLANFAAVREQPARIAAMLDAMLPVNSATGKSYATFTLTDIDNRTGRVLLMQYDNPESILLRGSNMMPVAWFGPYDTGEGRPGKFRVAEFAVSAGDRLVMLTDGVTQSGQATGIYRFGWGRDNVAGFCSEVITSDPTVDSTGLARQVVSKARGNDNGNPSDDTSCVVMTFRPPRRMVLVSCPPALARDNRQMAGEVISFDGPKVICGQPMAAMIASHTGIPLEQNENSGTGDGSLVYSLAGFDVVTDGMIVPGKVLDILEHIPVGTAVVPDNSIASRIVGMMLGNDIVYFRIGMRRNIDPRGIVPDEFSIRRNILRRIITVLEEKFGKQVETKFY